MRINVGQRVGRDTPNPEYHTTNYNFDNVIDNSLSNFLYAYLPLWTMHRQRGEKFTSDIFPGSCDNRWGYLTLPARLYSSRRWYFLLHRRAFRVGVRDRISFNFVDS